jgi:YHS domain-containing protein
MNNHKLNNPTQYHPLLLSEALEYKDMVGIMKPTVHVDEFASKMGDDDDIIVVSFFVRDRQAARDLSNWFEKGYDWVLDADVSPGEIRPGRYLVYIEMRRRSTAGEKIASAIEDLGTLTEFKPDQWIMHYNGKEYPFSREEFDRHVPLSPKEYRKQKESDLNEMRIAAGVEPVAIFDRDREIKQLQSSAGI